MSEIRLQENSIISQVALKLLSLGVSASQKNINGVESKKEFEQGLRIIYLLRSYSKKSDLSDDEIDSVLYCLRKLSDGNYFPTISPLVGKQLTIGQSSSTIKYYENGVFVGDSITDIDFVGGFSLSKNGNVLTVQSPYSLTGTVINLGDYDLSSDLLPDAPLGTGAGGEIKRGNEFDILVAGNPSGIYIGAGATIRAKVDNPGQDLNKWRIYY